MTGQSHRYMFAAVGVFLAPLLVNRMQGTFWAPDCNLLMVGGRVINGPPTQGSYNCGSLDFSADLPSLMLWASCILAIPLFFEFSRRLRGLLKDLESSGLVPTGTGTPDVLIPFSTTIWKGRPAWGRTAYALVFVSMVGVAVVFYFFTFDHSRYFAAFADSAGLPVKDVTGTYEIFQKGWWANWNEGNRWGTVVWILVGAIGAFFGLAQARLDFLLARSLRKQANTFKTSFVPQWMDSDHGWGPFHSVLLIATLAASNFALAVGAIAYLLVSDGFGLFPSTMLAIVATFGVFSNAYLLLWLRKFIKLSYGEAKSEATKELKNRMVKDLTGLTDLVSLGSQIIARQDARSLEVARSFPLMGFWRRAPALIVFFISNSAVLVGVVGWFFKR